MTSRDTTLADEIDWVRLIEEECWDVRCHSAGEDDINWTVSSHHMAAPQERIIGFGMTALEALQEAFKTLSARDQRAALRRTPTPAPDVEVIASVLARQKAATEAWPCPAKDARDAALEKDRPIGSAVLAKLHAIDEEAMYEAPASCNRAISEAIDEIVLAWREKNEAATALAAAQAEIARLLKAYQDTVAALDKHHGHPCEQIRHMHEVEGLKEENARKDERIAELRGALTSLLSFAKSVWFDEASCVEEEREEIDRAAAALRKDRA